MRTKVTINLSTDDPLEAELLDMLASINSSHRKQERLRSLLKAGYNMFYKNMAPEQAAMEAFDQHDVALILSLFGQSGAVQQRTRGHDLAHKTPHYDSDPQGVDLQSRAAPQPLPKQMPVPVTHQRSQLPGGIKAPSTKIYKQITGVLEEVAETYDDDQLLDVDPSILEASHEEVKETADIVDPLKKLFSR